MPSPFPGMDPFIEGQRWSDFHASFLPVLRELLMPQVRPRYIVEVEQYVYLAREDEDPDRLIEPDLSVVAANPDPVAGPSAFTRTASVLEPAIHTLPMPRRRRQTFLNIRNRQTQKVVTVIELLSPWNKTEGDGRTEYLVKRSNVLYTPAHLVELDLLRGGARLPTREPLAPADFYAFVCRKERYPRVEVYAWTLRQPLPVVPIPLAGGDPDASLDLRAAFTTTYDRAGYDYALDYRLPVEPRLDPATAEWVGSIVGQ